MPLPGVNSPKCTVGCTYTVDSGSDVNSTSVAPSYTALDSRGSRAMCAPLPVLTRNRASADSDTSRRFLIDMVVAPYSAAVRTLPSMVSEPLCDAARADVLPLRWRLPTSLLRHY